MSAAEKPLTAAELDALFADLACAPVLILAVSGGPDSTALLLSAARWRARLKNGPKLAAVTVDHRLRKESAAEARAVARLARKLKVPHRTLRWFGRKPKTGLQAKARAARYDMLAQMARELGARHVLTAHTRDDQAETLLLRLLRGSGLAGLGAMARASPLPASGEREIMLIRPLLDIPKARLLATLETAGIGFADDPSNRDPRFTRARLRNLMPALAEEGLSPQRLALLARRLARANAAIERSTEAAFEETLKTRAIGPLVFDLGAFRRLPEEISLRLLGRAIAKRGEEGPVELAKLEALHAAVVADRATVTPRFARTLAGALISVEDERLFVESAPPRRPKSQRPRHLTKRKGGQRKLKDRR